MKFRAQGALSN